MKSKKIKKYLYYLAFFIILILLFILAFDLLKSVIITILLVIIASLSKIYKRFIGYSIGFELVTFCTIIFLFSHNLLVAFLLSMLMLITSSLISGKISQTLPLQGAIYLVLLSISLFLRDLEITLAAKILVVFYNIILHSISLFFFRYPIHSSILNFTINIASNFILIDLLAVLIVSHI
ncbi:MAG: hypothetical protein ACMXYG_06525 [Candidatus Woesearchaeota archaeon]